MDKGPAKRGSFPPALEDAETARHVPSSPQSRSPAYRLAFQDPNFLLRDECRPVRLQLELLKPELIQLEQNVESTVVVFGSARIPDPDTARRDLDEAEDQARRQPADPPARQRLRRARRFLNSSRYYEEARRLAYLITTHCQCAETLTNVVTTGGGPGIMEAANRGAYDAKAKSVGLNIRLPREQQPNPFITPELCFQFHYFAIRKLHFLMRAKALVVFPGGFGTLDELFDALTLRQTGRMQDIPIIMFGREYWEKVINFQALADEGTIDDEDLDLFRFADTAKDAWQMILRFHQQ